MLKTPESDSPKDPNERQSDESVGAYAERIEYKQEAFGKSQLADEIPAPGEPTGVFLS